MKRLALVLVGFMFFFAAPRADAAFLNGTVEYDYLGVNLDVVDALFTAAATITSTSETVGDTLGTTSTGDFIAIVGDPPTLSATIVGLTYNAPTVPAGAFATFVGDTDGFTYNFFITGFTTTFLTGGLVAYDGPGYWTTTNPAFGQTAGTWTLTASRTGQTTVSYDAGGTLGALGTAVPEPASLILLGSGLLGLGAARRRRQARKR